MVYYKDIDNHNALDIAKFMCSILVIMIHSAPFGAVDGALSLLNYGISECFSRIAVPFYFMSSGYLLFRKIGGESISYDKNDYCRIKKYLYKILKIYLIWSIVYLPLNIVAILNNPKGIGYGTIIYLRDFVFHGSYWQLWYLNALIFDVILVSILLLVCSKKIITYISFLFYIIGLCCTSYYGIVRNIHFNQYIESVIDILKWIMVYPYNGLLMGFLFFVLGMLLAKYNIRLSKKVCFFGASTSIILLFLEAFLLRIFDIVNNSSMYIFLVPTTFFIFYIIISLKLSDNKIFGILRNMSMLNYLIHTWIIKIVYRILELNGIGYYDTSLRFLLVLFITLLCSGFIIFISGKKQFKWIKNIY